MKKNIDYSRREFIKVSTLAAIGSIPIVNFANSLDNTENTSNQDLKIYIFSKHLQFLDYKGMSEAAKDMGFDGIDLTVRPKGHVLPEDVAEDLPKATEAMKSFDLVTNFFTSRVLDANDEADKKVLETASQLGYKYYRTGWYKYAKDKSIQESVKIYGDHLKGLAQLNKNLSIIGSYQNHSGNYFGASIWDLDNVLEGISPKYMGSQYDIMHATVEGGKNWEIGFRLIKNHINTLVVKDFYWGKVNGKWKPIHVPLGKGMVNFKKYFSLLKQYKINVPLSIHCEYDLGGAEKGGIPSVDQKEVFNRIKKDLLFVRELWQSVS